MRPRCPGAAGSRQPHRETSGPWAGGRASRAGRPADWWRPARPPTSRRRELHPPPAFSRPPSPQAPASRLPPCQLVSRSSGPGPATPAGTLGPGPSPFPHFLDGRHHLLDVVLGPAAGLGPDRPARHGGSGSGGGRGTAPKTRGVARLTRRRPPAATASQKPSPPPCARARGSARTRPPLGARGLRAPARPAPGVPPWAPRESPRPPRRPGCAAARRHVLPARRGARRYRWGPWLSSGLDVGTFVLWPELLPLPMLYELDLSGCVVLLPLLSTALALQLYCCALTTEFHTFLQDAF